MNRPIAGGSTLLCLAALPFLVACDRDSSRAGTHLLEERLVAAGKFVPSEVPTDDYVVEVQPSTRPEAVRALAVELLGAEPFDVWEVPFGFPARVPRAEALRLADDARVLRVSEAPPPLEYLVTQSPAPAGLSEIDDRTITGDGTYEYFSDGSGVNIYILDTGIDANHPDLQRPYYPYGSKVKAGWAPSYLGSSTVDCSAGKHGTSVARVAAGNVSGVAKRATIYSVKASTCTAYTTDTISGLNWVAQKHIKPAVLNYSGGVRGILAPLEAAVENLISKGVTVVVAGGQDPSGSFGTMDRNACSHSPQRVANAITVGGSYENLSALIWEYFFGGSCIDINAPMSRYCLSGDTHPLCTQLGTSFSAPAVAGTAALWLQHNPTSSPAQVWDVIDLHSTKDLLVGLRPGTPNKLLYSRLMGPVCSGQSGSWQGCRGNGCMACKELLVDYPCYFQNHPGCTENDLCAGQHYTCGAGCPAPSVRDSCATQCGDGFCDPGETEVSCIYDCTWCGDGWCGGSETTFVCPQDCSVCGDGFCSGPETAENCASDCGGSCGDQLCF